MVLINKVRRAKVQKKISILSSRGIGARQRHLMKDIQLLLPHSIQEPKMDPKTNVSVISDMCAERRCTGSIYFECHRHGELFLWMGLSPSGPTAKFQVYNIHTMEELQLTGNHMLNSRPILIFDIHFDEIPHLRVLKELFSQVLAPPQAHPKVIPYVDHVFSFFYADYKIWFRHYQIVEKEVANLLGKGGITVGDDSVSTSDDPILVEVGPRFVLDPIRIFDETFSGKTIWKNRKYVSPSKVYFILFYLF